MFGSIALFLVTLSVPIPEQLVGFRDLVLGMLVFVLPAVLIFLRAYLSPDQRLWTIVLGLAVCSFMAGNLYYLAKNATGEVPFPSWADLGYLGIYPFLLAAVLLAIGRYVVGLQLSALTDAAIAVLAATAAEAWLIVPLVDEASMTSLAGLLSVAYPVGDLMVAAAALGALGLVGRAGGSLFASVAVGLLIISFADAVYLYRLTFDAYEVGTPLDALWALGFAIAASGAWRSTPPAGYVVPGSGSLVIASFGAATAVAVLAVGPSFEAHSLPRIFAILALIACGARVLLAFSTMREIAVLREQALTDDLCGIANRRALYLQMDSLLPVDDADADNEMEPTALVLIDLNRFKEVNDAYGHAAGDHLLLAVVRRFSKALAGLPVDATLARLGGDEFAVLMPHTSRDDALHAVAALRDTLSVPVDLDGVLLHVQASVGLAIAPEHGRGRSDLLFAADTAMYAAKSTGEEFSEFTPAVSGDRRQRRQIAEDLYDALNRDELSVFYQPLVGRDRQVVAAEALVRWEHPTRGHLTPADFLDVAERHRLTLAITERVLDVALPTFAAWHRQGKRVGCSVNISASDLSDNALVRVVGAALRKHDFPPALLTIEITETAMMRNPESALRIFHALHDLGVELSIDDYGTGQSSLEYLLRLPIDVLKLDRVFSADVAQDSRAQEIVRSTVQLAHALGLQLVAEGVETEATLHTLIDLGTDFIQGWHVGFPMPCHEFETRMLGLDGSADQPQKTRSTT